MEKIENDIPIPEQNLHNKKWPFRFMECGQSVLIVADPLTAKEKQKIRTAAHRYAFQNKKKFTTRNEDNGIRVWRVA